MFTTDIYIRPNDDHSTTAPVPVGVSNWLVRVHFDNVLETGNSVLGFAWTVHGRYKNNLLVTNSSILGPATGAVQLSNNLLLGQSAYLTCAATVLIDGSSSVTVTYNKTIQMVSENL